MENHKKLYNLRTEETTRPMERINVIGITSGANLNPGKTTEKAAHEAADARPFSNMANARQAQGTKRQLSLSPLKFCTEENTVLLDPDCSIIESEKHLSKKRLVSCQQIENLQHVEGKTGNDPDKGHGHAGSREVKELSRTKSKMAAPTTTTKTAIVTSLHIDNKLATGPTTIPKVTTSSPSSRDMSEGTCRPILDTSSPSSRDVSEGTCRPILESETCLSPSTIPIGTATSTKTSTTAKTCPSSTTAREAPEVTTITTKTCPSSTTAREAPEVITMTTKTCPSSTTAGEVFEVTAKATKISGTTARVAVGVTALPCSLNTLLPSTTAGETLPCPSDTTVGEVIEIEIQRSPSDEPTTESSSNVNEASACCDDTTKEPITSDSSAGEPLPKSDPKKIKLRPRNRVPAHKAKSTPCSSCSVCQESTNSNCSTKENPQRPAPRGRGRPRKNQGTKTSISKQKPQEPKIQNSSQNKSPDIFGVLLEIKNELGEVKEKQESCHDNLCDVMDTKLSDFKQSLGLEINNVKENVGKNTNVLTHLQAEFEDQLKSFVGVKTDVELNKNVSESLKNDVELNKCKLSDIEASQDDTKNKVGNLNQKLSELRQLTEGIELEVIRQKKNHNKLSLSVSTHVSEVEHELAQHIETIKTNMEEEVYETNQNQKLFENKLANFTVEITEQNTNLNVKIQDLQKDFEHLKTITGRVNTSMGSSCSFLHVSDPDTSPSSNLSSDSLNYPRACNSDTNSDDPYPTLNEDGFHNKTGAYKYETHSRFNSCDPDPDPSQNGTYFYMYGDTTRSVILDGIREEQNESLRDIVKDCITDIGIPITQADIENIFRIGKPDKRKSRPRPVKLILIDQTVRDQIFLFKARLRFSELYKDIRINKEEPKDVRIKIAKLRQAGQSARKQGHRVETRPGGISIDGISFNVSNLEDIPKKFMSEADKPKSPPQNTRRLSLSKRCKTKSNASIMVGPSLQKTPYGLAFYSEQSFLSNFYSCKICFRNQTFTCLEQGYQCTKAELSDDEAAYDRILGMTSQVDMKREGAKIVTTAFWEAHKLEVMEDLLFCKFQQNKKLYYSLLNTRPWDLIEATLDRFWGAGCLLWSIALIEGSWEGRNNLGKLLVKVRNFFVKELEIGQGSIQ